MKYEHVMKNGDTKKTRNIVKKEIKKAVKRRMRSVRRLRRNRMILMRNCIRDESLLENGCR
jgi:hypothetical protein